MSITQVLTSLVLYTKLKMYEEFPTVGLSLGFALQGLKFNFHPLRYPGTMWETLWPEAKGPKVHRLDLRGMPRVIEKRKKILRGIIITCT